MKQISVLLFLLLFCTSPLVAEPIQVNLGPWFTPGLEQLINDTRSIDDPGARIVAISARLLDIPYAANTLVGGPEQPERLVIDLTGFDCFTLLDTVEALRRSSDASSFPEQLRQVRYKQGRVNYADRNHFFSDWVTNPGSPISDVTRQVGQARALAQTQQLNRKADGSLWLPGIPVVPRQLVYIPTDRIDREVVAALQAGDYVGIYSDRDGLDVSHVGLIVFQGEQVLLRHASSRRETGRVLDEDLLGFLQDKPGLVVYRVEE